MACLLRILQAFSSRSWHKLCFFSTLIWYLFFKREDFLKFLVILGYLPEFKSETPGLQVCDHLVTSEI